MHCTEAVVVMHRRQCLERKKRKGWKGHGWIDHCSDTMLEKLKAKVFERGSLDWISDLIEWI